MLLFAQIKFNYTIIRGKSFLKSLKFVDTENKQFFFEWRSLNLKLMTYFPNSCETDDTNYRTILEFQIARGEARKQSDKKSQFGEVN